MTPAHLHIKINRVPYITGSQALRNRRRARPERFACGDLQYHQDAGRLREGLHQRCFARSRIQRNVLKVAEAVQVYIE